MRKILVGVDLSADSQLAIGHAVALARRDDAEVVLALVDAVPTLPDGLGELEGAAADTYASRLRDRLAADHRELEQLRERWAGHGARISQLVTEGYPDVRLPELATELDADLLVVGSHGRTGLKRFLFGSTAERVVRHAERDVLVARLPVSDAGYRHIVVGTDFTPHALRALTKAIALAGPGARIDVLHCWQLSPLIAMSAPYGVGAPPVDPGSTLRAGMVAGFASSGAALLAQVSAPEGTDVQFHLREDPAGHGLEDFAREARADLVVVGSHGRRGWRRFVLGSVAEVTVRHAPCAVLVVR